MQLYYERNSVMKKFRPYCAGFIVLYVLAALSFVDVARTLYSEFSGTANEMLQTMSLFTYLIFILAVLYVKMYAASRVVLTDTTMQIVNPVNIKPAPGAKRAMFVYRNGETDVKQLNKTFRLEDLEKYGWIEDLNYARLDASGVGEKNKLFPVHEIALVMKDGKRYHMNGGFYKEKQLRPMMQHIKDVTGIAPTGKLADLLK